VYNGIEIEPGRRTRYNYIIRHARAVRVDGSYSSLAAAAAKAAVTTLRPTTKYSSKQSYVITFCGKLMVVKT